MKMEVIIKTLVDNVKNSLSGIVMFYVRGRLFVMIKS